MKQEYEDIESLFEDTSSLSVKERTLRTKSINFLKKLRVRNREELTSITREELMSMKYGGEITVGYIEKHLNKYGLRFRELIDEADPNNTDSNSSSLNKSIGDLNLSSRAYSCLEKIGLNEDSKIGELAERTEDELSSIQGLGRTTLRDLKRSLEDFNVYLRR